MQLPQGYTALQESASKSSIPSSNGSILHVPKVRLREWSDCENEVTASQGYPANEDMNKS
jgi:hypothetical protein